MDLCAEFGIRSTFFFIARQAQKYQEQIKRLQALGHEIGCHGLTHADEEEYNRMPVDMQRAYIEEATGVLEELAGAPIVTFRSPRVKISAQTLGLLAEHGYKADSSICSQRMDLVSANLVNLGWLRAPRLPYHPRSDNAFKRGDLPIWEIPVSAMILPFTTTVLNVLGVRFMRVLFQLLYREARRTGKPIVYLAHPFDFVPRQVQLVPLLREGLSPTSLRTHGLPLRWIIYRLDGDAWFQATRDLFAFMASFPDVRFMTMQGYADAYLRETIGTEQRVKKVRTSEVVES